MALTDKALKALKPKSHPYRISDKGGTRGLNIQVTPAGSKIWQLRYTQDGKERFHSFDTYPAMSLANAREEVKRLKEDIRGGRNIDRAAVEARRAETPTVEVMINGYLDDMADRKRASVEQVRSRVKQHVIPEIGDMLANEVTENDIKAVLGMIYRKGHRTMANRVRSYLISAFRWARRHDNDYRGSKDLVFGIKVNPAAEIPRDAAAEQVDDRVLTWLEIGQFWYACSDTISAPMRLALQLGLVSGGQRPSEFLGISDKEIDEGQQIWTLPGSRSKNGRTHIVPLTGSALAIIEKARKIRKKSEYLFPSTRDAEKPAGNDALYHAVVKLCDRTGADPWTPKDIRTTFKTRGGEIGLSKEIRDRIQNHAMTDVSSRHYDHYDYMPEKMAALEAWEKTLLNRY